MSVRRRLAGCLALVVGLVVAPWAGYAEALDAADVTADGVVLWEPATDAWLFERDADTGRPMASTTKIMTVLLALESGTVDDEVVVSQEAAAISAVPGGASLGLQAGQRVPMRSLLSGLLMRSGNGAAVAVAEHVAGTEAAFVDRMNARAADLGLADTHFVNSSGLTNDPAHRASPRDLARLAAESMADERFAAWAGAATLFDEVFGSWSNRNLLLETFPGATGVKTGYTALAGLCLVASATRDGRTLYAVVLGSEDSFGDVTALLTHGFEDYREVQVPTGEALHRYAWSDGTVEVVPDRAMTATVQADAKVRQRVVLHPWVDRPLTAGDVLGQVTLLDGDEEVATADLAAATDVASPTYEVAEEAVGAAVQDALRGLVRLRPTDHDR